MADTPAKPDRIVVGKVTGVWGVRGWFRIASYTEHREDIFAYQPWFLTQQDGTTEVSLLEGKRHGNGLLACINGVTDRGQAEKWIGCEISVSREQLLDLPQGEYYWRQLIGLKVVTRDSVDLGEVKSLLPTGANDVLVVAGERERLIPYVPQVVKTVDLDTGLIRVDWDPEF